MFNEKQKKPFVVLSFICDIIKEKPVIAASLAQAIEALNGTDVILFCRDTGSKQGRPSFVFFFFLSVSLLISKTKTFI